jgi:hemerythrin-like metal-binding protein
MTIKSKLNLLSAIPVFGLILGVVLIYSMVRHTNRQIDLAQNRYAREVELARKMQFDVVQVQQFLTDFSATRGQDGLDDGIGEAGKFHDDLDNCVQEFKTLAGAAGETDDVRALDAMQGDIAAYWEVGLKMANLYAKEGTAAGNKFMPNFDKAADGLTEKLEPFVKAQQLQFSDSLRGVQSANNQVASILTYGGLVLLIITFGFSAWTNRSISGSILQSVVPMHANVVLTSSVAQRISESSAALADGASAQAASVEETSASLEEMSSMTRRNSESAQKVDNLAKQTRTAAERGAGDMQEMNTAMETIKASSGEISKIIKTIDEIAFQTNILALNAAVEAARAGEAGMGFAVVADEVRNLAQRSAQAAKETAAKIEGAISNTSRGVELSGKVAEALNDIVAKAREMDELAAELATASNEQTLGISQINDAVNQVDKVTQTSAAGAQENAAAAKDLNLQTSGLKQAVEDLLYLVNGDSDASHYGSESRHDKGVVQWNQTQMTTSVDSIDQQHQELIRLINAVHETANKRKAGNELMKQLNFLGEYAQNHFSHEEKIMDSHRCPVAGKNKAAHAKFLGDYQKLVQEAQRTGPTPELAHAVKEMLAEWLTAHICKVDTNLRGCHPPQPYKTSMTKAEYRQAKALPAGKEF